MIQEIIFCPMVHAQINYVEVNYQKLSIEKYSDGHEFESR